MVETPSERLKFLNGRRFPARAVMHAAEVNQDALTNYHTKYKLDASLCSETAGQGRARRYCLADVYTVALLRALSQLSGSVKWAAMAVDYLLFADQDFQAIRAAAVRRGTNWKDVLADTTVYPEFATVEQYYKQLVCKSIDVAPLPYKWRDPSRPVLLFADALDIKLDRPIRYAKWGEDDFIEHTFRGGIVWNATMHLIEVDGRLREFLNEGPNARVGLRSCQQGG